MGVVTYSCAFNIFLDKCKTELYNSKTLEYSSDQQSLFQLVISFLMNTKNCLPPLNYSPEMLESLFSAFFR